MARLNGRGLFYLEICLFFCRTLQKIMESSEMLLCTMLLCLKHGEKCRPNRHILHTRIEIFFVPFCGRQMCCCTRGILLANYASGHLEVYWPCKVTSSDSQSRVTLFEECCPFFGDYPCFLMICLTAFSRNLDNCQITVASVLLQVCKEGTSCRKTYLANYKTASYTASMLSLYIYETHLHV